MFLERGANSLSLNNCFDEKKQASAPRPLAMRMERRRGAVASSPRSRGAEASQTSRARTKRLLAAVCASEATRHWGDGSLTRAPERRCPTSETTPSPLRASPTRSCAPSAVLVSERTRCASGSGTGVQREAPSAPQSETHAARNRPRASTTVTCRLKLTRIYLCAS